MVVADAEKIKILQTDEWKVWVGEKGAGAKRWAEIEAFRSGEKPPDANIRNFRADVHIRQLIAEFIRPDHHRRAADVIAQYEVDLGLFAFGDEMLRDAIASVCVGHGLRTHELEDDEQYPDLNQIQGEDVNLRFIAIMLRLGDLLDMSNDRACPWLMNAASPLPSTSYAHWTQYQCIKKKVTSPEKITISARPRNQNEHRVLQDWCQWIEDEVTAARTIMASSARHSNWKAPEARLGGTSPTIRIKPAEGADYFPSEWKLELDNDAIFQRLIYDVYDQPETFIRELIQNALDATRCQAYADLKAEGIEPPEYPTQIDDERRKNYPIRITLKETEVANELSGETTAAYLLSVEDCGIGMDREIIERYFLQIGRTYYDTEEFRRKFGFVPTSRFGLGFLSVFAVSELVTVETYKPSSDAEQKPLRLTLTGPKSYLLTEWGTREASGTRIEVLLQEPLREPLGELVSSWCKRVEFPIIVNALDQTTEITSEGREEFEIDVPDPSLRGTRFRIRSFPTDVPGIEGDLFIFARIDSAGEEDWTRLDYAKYTLPSTYPQFKGVAFPDRLICAHGIRSEEGSGGQPSARIDVRRRHPLTLNREGSVRHSLFADPDLASRWEEIVRDHLSTSHLANGEDGWQYKQELIKIFPLDFWEAVPETLRVYINGEPKLLSLLERGNSADHERGRDALSSDLQKTNLRK